MSMPVPFTDSKESRNPIYLIGTNSIVSLLFCKEMKCLTCPTLPTHLEPLFILTTEDIVPSVLVFAA